MSEKAENRRAIFLDNVIQKYIREERQYWRERRAFHKKLNEQIATIKKNEAK